MSDASLYIFSAAATPICLLKLSYSVVLALHNVLIKQTFARFYFVSDLSLPIAKINKARILLFF